MSKHILEFADVNWCVVCFDKPFIYINVTQKQKLLCRKATKY